MAGRIERKEHVEIAASNVGEVAGDQEAVDGGSGLGAFKYLQSSAMWAGGSHGM